MYLLCSVAHCDYRTILVEGAGHYVQEDAPKEIVAAIRDWPAAPPASIRSGASA